MCEGKTVWGFYIERDYGDNDFFHVRYFALEISDYGNGLECVEDIKSKIEEIEEANKNE